LKSALIHFFAGLQSPSRINVERPNLSRLEHAKHVPSLDTLERIADAPGVPVVALVAA